MRVLLALLVGMMSFAAAGCRACGALACEDAFSVGIRPPMGKQFAVATGYTVSLAGSAPCAFPIVSATSTFTPISCDRFDVFDPFPKGFSLSTGGGLGTPLSVGVKLSKDGKALFDGTVPLAYQELDAGNGPGCGPTCQGGAGNLTASIP